MDKREKAEYLYHFINVASSWLKREDAAVEYDYLCSRIDKSKIDFFHFGYFPNSNKAVIEFIDEFAAAIGDDPIPILREIGLIYLTEKFNKIVPFFKKHPLLIPFYDVYGDPISIVGRTLMDEKAQKENSIGKYKYIPFDKRRHVFGLNYSYRDIVKEDCAVCVEGQFDFFSGYCGGICNIAALGGSKFTFEQVCLLKRFTNNFYVLLDNDDAGESGREKIAKQADGLGVKINLIELPHEYKDFDEFIKDGGKIQEL